VGRQGLNVPRATSHLLEESPQCSLQHSASRRLNQEGIFLNPEGNDLNTEVDTLNLASADEAAWQFFGEGLLQSDEDELMPGHPSEQSHSASKEAASASVPVSLTMLG
jgi:hypothetical protein